MPATPDLDALLAQAKVSLARADALSASIPRETPRVVTPRRDRPRAAAPVDDSAWGRVKRVAGYTPMDEQTGDNFAEDVDPQDRRDSKALRGEYGPLDTLKSFLAGSGKGFIDTLRGTATPAGLATLGNPRSAVGRLASAAGSTVFAGQGIEALADDSVTGAGKAMGAAQTAMGLMGILGAAGPHPTAQTRSGAGARGEFSPWEAPAPKPPVPETPIPVSTFEGSGRAQPIAESITPRATNEPLTDAFTRVNRDQPALDFPAEPVPSDFTTQSEPPAAAAPPKPKLAAPELAAMLRGREKFDAANLGADVRPGMRDELDRSGVEYGRTQAELKRLLGMPDADPVEVARMQQGARELGSRLRRTAKDAVTPPPPPVDTPPVAPPPVEESLPPGRSGHFTLPKPRAVLNDAALDATRERLDPTFAQERRQNGGVRVDGPDRRVAAGGEPVAETPQLSDRFQQEYGPVDGPFSGNPEAGAIDPHLLANLLRVPAGAAAGAYFDPEDRVRGGMLGGALGGATLIPGLTPKAERLRYFSMLMGPAQAKNIVGNSGVALSTAAERAMTHGPAEGGRVLKEFFSPKTLDKAKQVFQGDSVPVERLDLPESTSDRGVMGLPFRLMGAGDEAAKDAFTRAGVTDAAKRTFTADPESKIGQGIMSFQRSSPLARVFLPFVKTAVNQAEAGVTSLTDLLKLGDTADPALRRQIIAKALLAGGYGAAGAAYGTTDFAKEHPKLSPWAAVAAGPGALPFAVSQQFSHALDQGKSSPEALTAAGSELSHQLPMPSEWATSIPALLASLVPTGLRSLNPDDTPRDTTGSVFGPLLSRIPFLSRTLPAKRRARRHADD